MKVEYVLSYVTPGKLTPFSPYGLYLDEDTNRVFILHTNARTFLSIGPNTFSTGLWAEPKQVPTFNYRKIAELDQLTLKVN